VVVVLKNMKVIKKDKKMNFINSWRKGNKQDDKFLIWIRLGRITAFKIYLDISSGIYEFTVLNFGIKNK
jgi:hypothetical protein